MRFDFFPSLCVIWECDWHLRVPFYFIFHFYDFFRIWIGDKMVSVTSMTLSLKFLISSLWLEWIGLWNGFFMIAMMDFGELKILNGIRVGLNGVGERIQLQKIIICRKDTKDTKKSSKLHLQGAQRWVFDWGLYVTSAEAFLRT